MSDATQICVSQIQWIPQLIGALLAIVGGFFAVIARLRLEKKQEIDYIKISLIDELHEVSSIIDKMSETHNAAKIIPQSYFNELDENRDAFERYRPKLFLIGASSVRKSICDFYKKLAVETKKSIETVGTLKEGDTTGTKAVTDSFTKIKTASEVLENQIKNYRFKPFWFI